MTQTQEQWEKEFDEIPTDEINGQYGDYVNKVKVKRFIRKNFTPTSTVLEEIEKAINDEWNQSAEAQDALSRLKQALITNSKEV